MSTVQTAINSRLEFSTKSNPPVPPLDRNTCKTPQVFRGTEWSVDVGIFNAKNVCVDLSNLQWLMLAIYPWPVPQTQLDTNFSQANYSNLPFPSVPPAPLLFQTVAQDDIMDKISWANWQGGTKQQARFTFPWEDMASLNLNGQQMLKFLIVLKGFTDESRMIVYGNGPLMVYESGSQGIYLPNKLAPNEVPLHTTFYVQPNTQLTFGAPITVTGDLVIDGTLVEVE